MLKKIKRKKEVAFKKQLRKSMKKFKSMVKCASCGAVPAPGENIDQWTIQQKDEKITLTCDSCSAASGETNDKE
tara:strand:- start:147 stop:368 length:222 start_codon:yes stop_codon:yes gene_type:complete